MVTDRCSKDVAGGKFKLTYSIFKECFHRDAQIIRTIIPYTDRKEPFIRTGRVEGVGVLCLFSRNGGQKGQAELQRSTFQMGAGGGGVD